MQREELGNIMTVRAKPVGALLLKNNGRREDEGESKLEPHVGLEFDSAEDAQEFYNLYAAQAGFKIRIGQLYRSRVDGSVISRRFVCSKEAKDSILWVCSVPIQKWHCSFTLHFLCFYWR